MLRHKGNFFTLGLLAKSKQVVPKLGTKGFICAKNTQFLRLQIRTNLQEDEE
jgi:hypothetical protein